MTNLLLSCDLQDFFKGSKGIIFSDFILFPNTLAVQDRVSSPAISLDTQSRDRQAGATRFSILPNDCPTQ